MRSGLCFRAGRWPVALFLVLLLSLASAVGAVAGEKEGPPPALHPALWALARTNPDFRVPVIVQKSAPGLSSKELAASSQATVDEEYGFIGSFRMRVAAKALPALARNPQVRYITPDGPASVTAISDQALVTTFPLTAGATSLWSGETGLTGQGITVAVLDSGVNAHTDLTGKVVTRWSTRSSSQSDPNGHGTHVAGILAGQAADGRYLGIAPDARIVAVKVADDKYQTSESSVVKGLQWVYDNRATYGIRIVNLSISAQTPVPYAYSPLAAAVEKLWFSGVVVVVAAGNRGPGQGVMHYPPANDPFVITVGALDDNQTVVAGDDSIAPFSSYGLTQNGLSKPELVAPGRKVVAPLANANVVLAKNFPGRITADGQYIRLSGTSMATPVVSGLVALMLQRYPNLTPDQVKWALTATVAAYAGQPAGTAGRVDPAAALALIAQYQSAGTPLGQANQGFLVNPQLGLLQTSTSWETTNWSQATYTSAYAESAYWETAYWETAYWEASYWEAAVSANFYDETSVMDDTSAMDWD